MLFLSNPLQGSSLKDSGDEPYKFPGISMKTGFAITASARKDLEDKHRRYIMKAVAEAAQERAEAVQFVFAFKHNFLIPGWLREELPEEVSSKLLSLDMHGIQLNVKAPLQQTRVLTSALLHLNNLETSPFVASMSHASRLIRLVNEAGFDKDASPFGKAKKFALLAMRLDNYGNLGLTQVESDHMMGALYGKASQEILSVADQLPHMALGDLYTSAAQLKRWAAHRILNPQQKMSYVVDSLELFKKARQHVVSAENRAELLAKIKQEQHFALDFFEDLLLKEGLREEGVKSFIEARRSEI